MPNIPLEIFQSILFFIPAAVTNPGAVITGGHFSVDFGKKFVDGRRIFGDGKTWSGFFGGVGTGIILGLIIFAIITVFNLHIGNFSYSLTGTVGVLVTMCVGSLLGDMAGSFIKHLSIPSAAPSLGGVESLITLPVDTSHSSLLPEKRRSMGIEDGLVRFSTGIEDHEDLIADIQKALETLT